MLLRFPSPARKLLLACAAASILAACGGRPAAPDTAPSMSCPPVEPCPKCPECPTVPEATRPQPPSDPAPALQPAGWDDLPGWKEDVVAQAWPALLRSCSTLQARPQWTMACERAFELGEHVSDNIARSYFEGSFQPWVAINPDHTDTGLVTGYYEPLIRGSRTPTDQHAWPVHAAPDDLLVVDLGNLHPELRNMRLRGRLVGNRIIPYWNRAEIDALGDALPARVLLWASDPIDLFFLQIQGSGQVELPGGDRVRLGYADHNGHPYHSIGRWLVAQGEISLEKASMQEIKNWARANPLRLRELLNVNPGYVFFRELPASADGPLGALGVPLSAGRSIAVDPRYIPLGAPVFLATTYPLSSEPLQRLMVAQDTGGAIKGVVRADLFWGFGDEAGAQAGRMRQQGRMWVLLPKGLQP
ncbi:MAG: MltA domain-containing protein [Rhodocyclaceae bacterium]|nr:MltA domain-containing protein [Rhodocyclaceae bacterium]